MTVKQLYKVEESNIPKVWYVVSLEDGSVYGYEPGDVLLDDVKVVDWRVYPQHMRAIAIVE